MTTVNELIFEDCELLRKQILADIDARVSYHLRCIDEMQNLLHTQPDTPEGEREWEQLEFLHERLFNIRQIVRGLSTGASPLDPQQELIEIINPLIEDRQQLSETLSLLAEDRQELSEILSKIAEDKEPPTWVQKLMRWFGRS